jgi:hypothetical protein
MYMFGGNSPISAISKILTNNDTGESGSHQAGIVIPKRQEFLRFFPDLDPGQKNPYRLLAFVDEQGLCWKFKYIYYNNKFFGGTRNEFRLTRMTGYIREKNLSPGDEIILSKDDQGRYNITCPKHKQIRETTPGTIILGTGWKITRIRK